MAFYRLRRIWDTALYQGYTRESGYFEGWYFKHVSADGSVYSVIPGIAMARDGTRHAFIQTIDGSTAETHYVTYPYEEFSSSKDQFIARIAGNTFSRAGMNVSVRDGDFHLDADLRYTDIKAMPFSLLNPNAMGWYSFVPFMECYHGLLSMDHEVRGHMTVNNRGIDFDGGRGYIEKDWGRSFPSSWVWMQTNEFPAAGDSFMLSIANIPWRGSHFVGFLGFLRHGNTVHRFATYTGAQISDLHITEDGVTAELRSKNLRLTVTGSKKRKGMLKAPVNGVMERRIAESIDATISINALDNRGRAVFCETGSHGGLEIVGETNELIEGI